MKRISVLIFLAILFVLLATIYWNKQNSSMIQDTTENNTSDSVVQNSISFKLDLDSEGKEYETEYQKTSSSSGWLDPESPRVIVPEENPIGKVTQADWEEPYNTTFKEALDKADLTDFQYRHLLSNGYAPSSIDTHDFNGDDRLDKYISSVGMGCASCRLISISIFINDHVYVAHSNQGSVMPFKDEDGFILTNFGEEPSFAMPNSLTASKYYWENNRFIEKQQKTIWLTEK